VNKGKGKKLPLFAVAGVIVAGLVVFGVLRFLNLNREFLNEDNNDIAVKNPDYQIDVLNGCGIDDVAFQITQYLRIKGFDVIDYGNYGTTVNESFIIDHVGKPDTARLIARMLGIDEKKIIVSRSNYYNEFTVVIGKDYIMLKPFKNKGEGDF